MDSFTLLDKSYDHDLIRVNKFLEHQKNSYIFFVSDADGNNYLVKQPRSMFLKDQLSVIFEKLSADIAHEVGILAHSVCIIPAGTSFPGKIIAKRVATLHTVVPGQMIRVLKDGKFAGINIKQTNDMSVSPENQGLCEENIYYMSLHSDLALIMALDTFIGNRDRNKANVLYDERTGHFYAIDMSCIYTVYKGEKNLALIAYEHLENMIMRKKKFSDDELLSLRAYRDMLKKLVDKFPPDYVFFLLKKYITDTRLIDRHYYTVNDIFFLLNDYKVVISESYKDVNRIIALLSDI